MVQYQSTLLSLNGYGRCRPSKTLSVEVLLLTLTWLQPHSCLCGICSSCGSAGISVVVNRIDHIFDRSIAYSDPRMRIVLIHGLNSNFNSLLEVLKTGRDFQYKSNSHISSDPPFWLRSFVVSWKGVFATKTLFEVVLNSPASLGHEILSNFDNTHKSCFLTKFTQFVFW